MPGAWDGAAGQSTGWRLHTGPRAPAGGRAAMAWCVPVVRIRAGPVGAATPAGRAARLVLVVALGLALAIADPTPPTAARAADRPDAGTPLRTPVLSQPRPAAAPATAPAIMVTDGPPPLIIGPEDEAWLVTFITGNTLFVFFHELGHALVSDYDIPVSGREEDAVDQLAALILIDWRRETELATDFLFAVADAWKISAWQAARDDGTASADAAPAPAPAPSFYKAHSLDRDRFDAVLCLLYGSNPAAFSLMLMEGDLTHQRAAGCPRIYWQASAAWNQALRPYIRRDGAAPTPDAPGRFRVRYRDNTDPATRRWKPFLQRTGVFEALAASLTRRFVLRRDITIRLTACGRDNAFWDAPARRIVICYELMQGFADLAVAALRP